MSAIASERGKSSEVPWGLIILIPLVIAVFALFMLYVVTPWANAKDSRDAHHAAEQLAAIHQQGFVNVTNNDLYESSYYNGPTAFKYQVGTCKTELIVDGSGAGARTYIWLKSIEDTQLYVTYRQLTHIPQTAACFSR